MAKKEVSGDIPFDFLHQMGHNTRAMDRFFALNEEERNHLLDHAAISDQTDTRIAQTLDSLAAGGEGYIEPF